MTTFRSEAAQALHRKLAKPVVESPFQAAARRTLEHTPAGPARQAAFDELCQRADPDDIDWLLRHNLAANEAEERRQQEALAQQIAEGQAAAQRAAAQAEAERLERERADAAAQELAGHYRANAHEDQA